ncbi:uncharacterized protein LOC144201900 isoform X1 [Stigmatopora nigra]
MSCNEDASLLFLISKHLKTKGLQAAADVLEEHVSKIEIPNMSLNLQDIYKGWLKLCSLSQPAKCLDGVEPDECDGQSPEANNNADEQVKCAPEAEGTNGHGENGCHETQSEEQQPEMVTDDAALTSEVSSENDVNQTEATPKVEETANDSSEDEVQVSSICLTEQETFPPNKEVAEADVPPSAGSDVLPEPVREESIQLEQEDQRTEAPDVPADEKMAAEERDHLNVAITLNIDVCKNNEEAPPKKKKKKLKTEEPEQDPKVELDHPAENKKAKKRKEKNGMEDEEGKEVQESVEEKKTQKKRKKEKESEGKDQELQAEEEATQVEEDAPIVQVKDSRKRRQRKKRAERMKQLSIEEEQTLPPEPFEPCMDDAILEEEAPKKKKMKTHQVTPPEENLPPIDTTKKKNKKKKKKPAPDEEAVEDDVNTFKDLKKKRKASTLEEQVEEVVENGKNATKSLKKVNKRMESEDGDETLVTSDYTSKKKRKKKVKNKMGENGNA